jgi:putative NADPH-quinone reductase
MAKLIVYYAHPGHKYSHVNRVMAAVAAKIDSITFVDLYHDYPRYDIDVNVEQRRLLEHDVVLIQFPLFWYSTPSIIKEWQDLVLEHGFAYGSGGDRGQVEPHVDGYRKMLEAIRDDRYDFSEAEAMEVTDFSNLPIRAEA